MLEADPEFEQRIDIQIPNDCWQHLTGLEVDQQHCCPVPQHAQQRALQQH